MRHSFLVKNYLSIVLFPVVIFAFYSIKFQWNYNLMPYIILLYTAISCELLERLIPKHKSWQSNKKSLIIGIKHLLFSVGIFDGIAKVLAISIAIYLQKSLFSAFTFWSGIPLFISYIIATIIGEFLPYLYHRVSHVGDKNSRISLFLWKIHSIHHLPTKMSWLKTNWIHPINIFMNGILKLLPLLLLGFSEEVIYLVGITHIVIAFLSHGNFKTEKSFWDYIIVTPHIHHYHHSVKLEEAKNYGNIIPLWDIIFGSYINKRTSVREVGVIQDSEINYPNSHEFIKQWYFPFLKKGEKNY